LDRRLGGQKGRSGRGGEEKNSSSTGLELPIIQSVAFCYTTKLSLPLLEENRFSAPVIYDFTYFIGYGDHYFVI
jgi:hypothetical protein